MSAIAVALDKVLIRLTDADRAQMRRNAPTALVDQFDAATAEVDQLITGIARDHNAATGAVHYANVPQWLRLALVDTWQGFITGTIDTCQHSPVYLRPQPVIAAVWRPGLIVCAHCAFLTRAVGAADLRCDRCHRDCLGLERGDGIHPCSITFGPLLYAYGLCAGCMNEHTEATT